METTYISKLAPRRRRPWAFIIGPGDEIETFTGVSIPGKVAVIGYDYKQDGVWSAGTYRLQVAPGVRFLHGHFGFETGTFLEGLRAATGKPTDRWHEVANALGISVRKAQEFIRDWHPRTAEKLDQVEEDLASLDESCPNGITTTFISYGAPSRAQRDKGFWEWPVRVLDSAGREVGRVSATGKAFGNVKVISRVRSSGHGGGYVSLMLAIPEGCVAEHGPVPNDDNDD